MKTQSHTSKFPQKIGPFAIPTVVVAIAAIAVIASLAGLTIQYQHHLAADQEESYKYEAIVNVTSQGLVPSTITIHKDTRLYIQNQDQNAHVLVANQVYKAEALFARSQAMPIHGGYAYNFHHSGTYAFHDAAHPTWSGQIIVQK